MEIERQIPMYSLTHMFIFAMTTDVTKMVVKQIIIRQFLDNQITDWYNPIKWY